MASSFFKAGEYLRRYGFNRAVRRAFSRLAGRNEYETFLAVPEVKLDISRIGLSAGGVKGRVSVVIPTYNQAQFLPQALDGALSQTHPDFEVIVVDDGSTDDTPGVLARYEGRPHLKIIRQSNKKLPAALNAGFAQAYGEFLTWSSSDNIMHPEQLVELSACLKSNSSAAMVFSDYRVIGEDGLPVCSGPYRPRLRDKTDPSIVRLPGLVSFANLQEIGDNFIGASFLYRRAAAVVTGAYSESTFGGEDYDYWLRMNLMFDIRHLPKSIYEYRVHSQSLTSRSKELDLDKNIRRVLEQADDRKAFFEEPFMAVSAGLTPPPSTSGAAEKCVLAFRYSHRGLPDAQREFATRSTATVCVIGDDHVGADREFLGACDWILAETDAAFAELSVPFAAKTLKVERPDNAWGLFFALANTTLFERV